MVGLSHVLLGAGIRLPLSILRMRMQLTGIRMNKQRWEAEGLILVFPSLFCCPRAPGFDDCRDDGSLDELPHLHFQQQQHSLRYRHLAADPQEGFRAGADDRGQVLPFLYVSLLSSSVSSAAFTFSSLGSLRKIWCLKYRVGTQPGKELYIFQLHLRQTWSKRNTERTTELRKSLPLSSLNLT